jgi:hypothetical protein
VRNLAYILVLVAGCATAPADDAVPPPPADTGATVVASETTVRTYWRAPMPREKAAGVTSP